MQAIHTSKLHAGSPFPKTEVTLLNGDQINIATPENGADWKLIVVYRGKHCPLCTKYLNALESHIDDLKAIGLDTIAVSADNKAQLEEHKEKLDVSFPLAYGLTQQQMQELGLYISIPRSEKETNHNFAEPGLFVINQDGNIQVVDISNNPFVRPDINELVSGLQWIRNPDNNYPIRGTFK
jgi:peroxiredoxin